MGSGPEFFQSAGVGEGKSHEVHRGYSPQTARYAVSFAESIHPVRSAGGR